MGYNPYSISRVGFWAHLEPFFNMFFSKHFFHQRKNFAASEHPSDPAMYTKTKPFTLPPRTPWVPNEREGARIGRGLGRIFPLSNVSKKKMDGCRISMEFFQSKNHGFTKLFFFGVKSWMLPAAQKKTPIELVITVMLMIYYPRKGLLGEVPRKWNKQYQSPIHH